MKELMARIAVAVVAIPLLVYLILQGGWYFFGLITIIAVIGQWEFYNLAAQKESIAQIVPGILLTLILFYGVQSGFTHVLIGFALLLFVIIFSFEMFYNKASAILNISTTLAGVVYPMFRI
jgi:phosphatidate cytidylyltransferase